MTVTLDEFMKDFTPQERAKVAARTAELVEEELTLRDLRQAQHLTQERMAELMWSSRRTSRAWNAAPTCCSRRSAAMWPRWAASCGWSRNSPTGTRWRSRSPTSPMKHH